MEPELEKEIDYQRKVAALIHMDEKAIIPIKRKKTL